MSKKMSEENQTGVLTSKFRFKNPTMMGVWMGSIQPTYGNVEYIPLN